MAAAVVTLVGASTMGAPPAGADARPLELSPSSGPWFTTVTVTGAGCATDPATDLRVLGRLYASTEGSPQIGTFRAVPDGTGSWSAQFVVTHRGANPYSGDEGVITPGAYEVRATCGTATVDTMGGVVPGEPTIATYAAPFEVLAGGPTPSIEVTPTTVTITGGRAALSVSGDRCVRPDGPSSVLVSLDGPAGGDPDDPSRWYSAGAEVTPGADGRWTASPSAASTPTGPMAPKPGVYQLQARCLLGTDGLETPNSFAYEPVTVTLVDTTAPTTPPATPVPATPIYTG
jgi:hypothetical protein